MFGADTMSKVVDFSDRNTCILFGDAAGVVLVESSEDNGVFTPVTGTEGDKGKEIYLTGNLALLGFGGGLTYAGLCVRNDIARS